MSGGVDSSVAAALLAEQGYDVVGLMLRLWAEPGGAANRCCTPDAVADARRVANELGIPFYVRDYKDVFKSTVVDFFIDGYAQGVTPNPCVVGGVEGFCMDRSECDLSTHESTSGYCPGPWNIQCCTPR